ncbi:RagB/SusD family nutrient uptake outer membrane protein [Bacteroides congonensis]
MKKKIIILTAFMGLVLSACSDFLDRKPLTQPDNTSFLVGQEQVENYINGLYMALPTPSKFGMAVRGEEVNSDNILSEIYDRRLNGENNQFSGDDDWSKGYENLRNVNYFFHYYKVPEGQETAEVRSLRGEAYFLRAYWHFYLLTRFGDIPVMDDFWDGNATLEGLQIPASKRSDVARFILSDLKAAIGEIDEAKASLFSRSKYSGLRINKEAAAILAMRVALYEGSWEKYHKGTDFAKEDNSAEFFQEVLNWGDRQLFPAGLTLNTKTTDKECVNPEDAFAHLFNKKDYSQISEAVFWKKYSEVDGVYHVLGQLLSGGVIDNQGPSGLSKSLVDNYLNADGTFIDPTDDKYKDFNTMFEKRDGRLLATVMHTGSKFRSSIGSAAKPINVKEYDATGTEEEMKEKNADIVRPSLNGDGKYRNVTGFHINLGIDTTYIEGNNETGIILFRYAEGLLCYAEAAAELEGKWNDAVLNKTLKPLRERAGVTWVNPIADPHFPFSGLTPLLQEIRRERRSELALQGFRLDDLMRWAEAGTLKGVNGRGRGAYLGTDGVLYKSFAPKDQEVLKLVAVDGAHWMDPLQQYLPNGYLFDLKRDYLLPIPPDELQMNHTLHQNPGWEKVSE